MYLLRYVAIAIPGNHATFISRTLQHPPNPAFLSRSQPSSTSGCRLTRPSIAKMIQCFSIALLSIRATGTLQLRLEKHDIARRNTASAISAFDQCWLIGSPSPTLMYTMFVGHIVLDLTSRIRKTQEVCVYMNGTKPAQQSVRPTSCKRAS